MNRSFHVWAELGMFAGEAKEVAVVAANHADAARRFAEDLTASECYLAPLPVLNVRELATGELKRCKVAPVVKYESWEL